jgi:catecholate siderophore receptor
VPQTSRSLRFSTTPSLRRVAGSLLGVALAGAAQAQPPSARPGHDQSGQPLSGNDPVQLPPLSVQSSQGGGYQSTVPALPKLTEPLLDTPQSISVVPQQLMRDQATVTVRDALRNVPGISLAAGEAGAQGDSLTLRSFTARNDFYLDGMRDFGSYTRDPFNSEQIEVLKGPASVLFGRGSTGGVINQVSKQPTLAPITSGTAAFGTDGTKRLTLDAGRPIDGVAGTAFRINVMGNLNGITDRDAAAYRRFGVAPSLAFGLGTATRLTLNYVHQQEYDTPDYGLPWLFGRPADVPRSTFYGFKNSDYLSTRVDIGTIRLEHDLNANVTLRTQLRYGNYERGVRVTEPQVNYTGITQATPLSAISVNRNMIAVHSTETFLQNQSDATARFSTGPVDHALTAGFEVGKETSSPDRLTYTGVPSTNLLFPRSADFVATSRLSTASRTTGDTAGVFALDTIKLGSQWELLAGLRWDNFRSGFDQRVTPSTHFSRTDRMLSWRTALVYKPVPNGSFYFAYGTSFNPSAESLSLAASTADLAPEKNETYEVGTKWDVNGGRLTLTGAMFQIEKTNARVPDPNNPLFNILGGDQRVRGFEIGAAGHITDAWEIYSGYAVLDSQVVSSTTAISVGKALANTPKHTLNVWSSYELPWHGLQIGGGAQYLSSRLASITPNAQSGMFNRVDGYVTFQAMVKLPVRPGWTVQVNGFNLADVRYYDLLHPSHVVPGSGRTVLFSTTFSL